MNKVILQQAIEHVKSLVAPDMNLCQICHKTNWKLPGETTLDIIGTPTSIGLFICENCYNNLLIAIGEISMEY